MFGNSFYSALKKKQTKEEIISKLNDDLCTIGREGEVTDLHVDDYVLGAVGVKLFPAVIVEARHDVEGEEGGKETVYTVKYYHYPKEKGKGFTQETVVHELPASGVKAILNSPVLEGKTSTRKLTIFPELLEDGEVKKWLLESYEYFDV